MSIAKTFLAIGIAIILAIFVGYSLYILYKAPTDVYYSNTDCYSRYDCYGLTNICGNYNTPGYNSCRNNVTNSDNYKTCQSNYEKCLRDAEKPIYDYYRNKMIILTIIGIVAIIVGIFIAGAVGAGILGGGILTILYSVATSYFYWRGFNEYLKLGILFVVLVLLIFFGYKKFGKKE